MKDAAQSLSSSLLSDSEREELEGQPADDASRQAIAEARGLLLAGAPSLMPRMAFLGGLGNSTKVVALLPMFRGLK